MKDSLEYYEKLYQTKLVLIGVPLDPTIRTENQEGQARMAYFATGIEVSALLSVTQNALEKK